MISQNKKDDNDKIDILMNKITKLENLLNEEKKNKTKLEEKYNQLNYATLPLLNKQLNEKEKLLESTLIEQIKLQKEINYLKDNFKINDNFNNIYSTPKKELKDDNEKNKEKKYKYYSQIIHNFDQHFQ